MSIQENNSGSRVGFATTRLLEDMLKDYIVDHTVLRDGVNSYVGKPEYLVVYNNLRVYNAQGEVKK